MYNLQNELHTFIKRKVYYLFWRLYLGSGY